MRMTGLRAFQKRYAAVCAAVMGTLAAVALVVGYALSSAGSAAASAATIAFLGLALVAALAISAIAGLWLSSRALQPVAALTDALRNVSADSLGHRVPEG